MAQQVSLMPDLACGRRGSHATSRMSIPYWGAIARIAGRGEQRTPMSSDKKTLYERLGGFDAITAVANDLLPRLNADGSGLCAQAKAPSGSVRVALPGSWFPARL